MKITAMKRRPCFLLLVTSLILVSMINCTNSSSNPFIKKIEPITFSKNVGIWRLYKIETYHDNTLESSELIDETSMEQTFLEIDSSFQLGTHSIHIRLDCKEYYPWQPMVCDTLPPCRVVRNVTDNNETYFHIEPYIYYDLNVVAGSSSKRKRCFMRKYLKSFPPVVYHDTCALP